MKENIDWDLKIAYDFLVIRHLESYNLLHIHRIGTDFISAIKHKTGTIINNICTLPLLGASLISIVVRIMLITHTYKVVIQLCPLCNTIRRTLLHMQ